MRYRISDATIDQLKRLTDKYEKDCLNAIQEIRNEIARMNPADIPGVENSVREWTKGINNQVAFIRRRIDYIQKLRWTDADYGWHFKYFIYTNEEGKEPYKDQNKVAVTLTYPYTWWTYGNVKRTVYFDQFGVQLVAF